MMRTRIQDICYQHVDHSVSPVHSFNAKFNESSCEWDLLGKGCLLLHQIVYYGDRDEAVGD